MLGFREIPVDVIVSYYYDVRLYNMYSFGNPSQEYPSQTN